MFHKVKIQHLDENMPVLYHECILSFALVTHTYTSRPFLILCQGVAYDDHPSWWGKRHSRRGEGGVEWLGGPLWSPVVSLKDVDPTWPEFEQWLYLQRVKQPLSHSVPAALLKQQIYVL